MNAPSQLLLAAIRDPHDPRLCASCLLGCLEKIFPRSQRKSRPGATKRTTSILAANHDVWNALVGFLTIKRTNKQIQRALVRLSECNCKLADTHIQELHRIGDSFQPVILGRSIMDSNNLPPISLGFSFVLEILSLLLDALPSVGVKSVAKGLSTWPTSPTDLIPSGADAFVVSMIQWHGIIKDTAVFAMCGTVLRLCHLLVIPSLASHSIVGHLVEAGRALFDNYKPYLVSDDRSSPEAQQAARFFDGQLDMIELFLGEILHHTGDISTELFRGHETKLCQLSSLLLHVTTDPRFPRPLTKAARHALALCGQHLYRYFHMHLPPRPSIPLHRIMIAIDKNCFPPPASARSPPDTAYFLITSKKSETRCAGKNCENTIQSVGKNFQRCGRCTIIGYCGRDCQKQDWTNAEFPHKAVCPILRDLVAKAGGWPVFAGSGVIPGSTVKATVLRNWAAVGVSEADLKYLDDWRGDREPRRTILPDGTEWTPGYDDYDKLIWQFHGPKPDWFGFSAQYPDRLQRWPSEVAKVKAVLEILPFWDQDIVA
ncbi:hypothetical protein DXG01_002820 [Tephrocybe rancida]|nr:hypothetical protein DXG01_002820 [Tephrocybe rancida]